MKVKLAILFGGQSTEHEVSRMSAYSIIKNIDTDKYDIYPIGITKRGNWFEYRGQWENIENGHWEEDEENLVAQGERVITERKVDVVFPALHGLYGEDGTIQGFCKLFGICCVGAGVLASALCMDKVYTKYILEHFGIKQAPYRVFIKEAYEMDSEDMLVDAESLSYPLFVKPSNSGSSVGITKAHNREELKAGLSLAFIHDRKVLVEKGINAKEVEVAVLGNEAPEAAVPGEIVPGKEFYDYEAKYLVEGSKLLIPAAIKEEDLNYIKSIAVKVYKLLDCVGMARVDFLVDKDNGDIYLNEVNTIPGFTPISMYPKMWQQSGKPYSQLIEDLIQLALN